MTSKHDFKEQWNDTSAEARRERLDALSLIITPDHEHTEDERREHDALAEMVAEDEG